MRYSEAISWLRRGMESKLEWSIVEDEELVVQNLRREPHSSVTVRRFRKRKSWCHVIAIPQA